MASQSETLSLRWLLRTRRWFLIAPALLVMFFVGQIDKTSISLLIANSAFLKELQAAGRNATLGWLMGAFFVGYGASLFAWGFLVDRFGPRVCALAGTAGWAVVMLWMSRASSLEELLALRFLLGVAEGNQWPVGNTLINRWFPVREHSRVQAFWITGAPMGTAMGVPLVALFLLSTGWRGALRFLAILSLLPLLLLYFLRNHPRELKNTSQAKLPEIERDAKQAFAGEQRSFPELLKSTPFWLIVLCQTFSGMTVFSLIHWIPSFLTSSRQLTFAGMSHLIFYGYLAAMALPLIFGAIADRTMRRALTGACVATLLMLGLFPAPLLLPPVASALFLSLMVGLPSSTSPLNAALMHNLVRPEAIGRATGVYMGIHSVLLSLAEPIFGSFITLLHGKYWGGFLFLALLNMVSAICYLALHRISRKAVKAAVISESLAPMES